MNRNIFKAYDVRGLYPKDINENSISKIALALVSVWDSGLIVVAHDGRHGSEILAHSMVGAIESSGRGFSKKHKVIFIGLATTPMFYFLVNDLLAIGGAMITASHNPKEYNGVKAVREKAVPIGGLEILALIDNQKK